MLLNKIYYPTVLLLALGLLGAWATNPQPVDPCEDEIATEGGRSPSLSAGERVLVTGGCGFIGSHLVDKLLSLGYLVTVLDNLETGNITYLDLGNPNLTVIVGDVMDRRAVRLALSGVTGVFHLAAASKVLPSLKDPTMATFNVEQNAMGTALLLEEVAQSNLAIRKVVYAASSTFYGNQNLPYSEDLPFQPSSPYSAAKYMGELLMDTYDHVFNVPTVSLRFFMVYGPRQPEQGAYAIVTGKFARQQRAGLPLTIEGDGEQYRDFVHVQDVTDACILAYENEAVRKQVINIGSGKKVSVMQLANLLSTNHVYLQPRLHDLKGTLADTCKAKRLLHFQAKKDFVREMTQFDSHNSSALFWNSLPQYFSCENLQNLPGQQAQVICA